MTSAVLSVMLFHNIDQQVKQEERKQQQCMADVHASDAAVMTTVNLRGSTRAHTFLGSFNCGTFPQLIEN